MPISLDPSERFEYVLSTDRSKPKDQQPTFIFHYPTCRERKEMARLFDDADKAETAMQSLDQTCAAIRLLLLSWRNVTDRDGKTVPFDPANLDVVLSSVDLQELRVRLPSEMDGSEVEKKASALRLLSATAKSATDAEPVSA